ncbi:septum formation family protein [Nocardioides sp. ChNu-153]|uniref:septum formation family protein n=1 Tax=unclassified Nocardioides TaxID=2615069 RepID=UPI002404C084|nr:MULTISPECIES: septum formation family protein [unclassified Nocardioides]MDF9715456.1 septum formation family protein [Nocardioides sp. ChNu-99]MDN7120619.1 septum formation family protein [Nocardioides sp. ChNu-153]
MRNTVAGRVLAVGIALAGMGALSACGSEDDATRDEGTQEVTEAGNADAFSLQVGDCFDDPEGTEVTEVPAVPCAEPHDNEIFEAFDMDEGDWPGDDAVQAAVEEGCGGAFEAFVGTPYDTSALYLDALTPTEDSWTQGDDREILCVVFDPEGPVEGTLEGSAL